MFIAQIIRQYAFRQLKTLLIAILGLIGVFGGGNEDFAISIDFDCNSQ
jgi:uncharacterized membrane protein